jgi:hypothetical protein
VSILLRGNDGVGFLCRLPFRWGGGVDCRWKRLLRQSLQVPFELAAGVGLAGVLTMIFAVEVFMSEVYSGPFKQYLVRPATLRY